MKILIIDDEELLVKGISYNLENEGYQVVTGTNGLEAIRLAQDQDVGLIVLDVMMPVMHRYFNFKAERQEYGSGG